jgi:hypothetical protein
MAAHTEHARRQPTIDEQSEEALPQAGGGSPTRQRRHAERQHPAAAPTSMPRRGDDVRPRWWAIVSSPYGSMAILRMAYTGVRQSARACARLPRSAERRLPRSGASSHTR